jgi:hypothetical protein
LDLFFRYLHSFTPKNGVKVGQYFKNGYFLAMFMWISRTVVTFTGVCVGDA